MNLRAISLKGFKSFPDRTLLEFAPGVSVVVGPNGSGKSNVTDAVLWAMGEQSPIAVRGQSMQDVIFSGGHGRNASRSAEVELVFDNSDGALPVPAAEVSIMRRLDRNGEGEYRINGARCRMTDVLELLSDSGLGKEGHSVIGQGRVEGIVSSKPKDRRLLIEEAAGLGKHRRRRRRAQLKLDRTRDNLDRALDIEREARAHLRPLKRQAEAAETHARLERQVLETRWELVRDDLRSRAGSLADAESSALKAREERKSLSGQAAGIATDRAAAEQQLAGRAKQRDELAQRTFAVRAAAERLLERSASIQAAVGQIETRIASDEREMAKLERELAEEGDEGLAERRAELTARLAELDEELQRERAGEAEGLEAAVASALGAVSAAEEALEAADGRLSDARQIAVGALTDERAADDAAKSASAALSRAQGELAAIGEFLSQNGGAPEGAKSLADGIAVESGLELAVAAALEGRLSAAVVPTIGEGESILDVAGAVGGRALVLGAGRRRSDGTPPIPGSRCLAEAVGGTGPEAELARALLADAWLVDSLHSLADGFRGIAVTAAGRSWSGATGEIAQAPEGGSARVIAERNRADSVRSEVERLAGVHRAAEEALRLAVAETLAARTKVGVLEDERRTASSALDSAREEHRRAEWLLGARREAPQAGPVAVERARVAAELAAEERIAARLAEERDGNAERLARLAERLRRDRELTPAAKGLVQAIARASEAVAPLRERLDSELAGDGEQGDGLAAKLRELAARESELQARVSRASEQVTVAEVEAQRLRDRCEETETELRALAEALGLEAAAAETPLPVEERESLVGRLERLERRRSQLGPVNPLAAEEYAAALEHLEELEEQRKDLEAAMSELKQLIRDCDRTIKETFESTFADASEHFEDLVARLFPGGKGRLRLVEEESGPRPVLGGEPESADDAGDGAEGDELDREPGDPVEPLLGVEIEITPAGKSMRRLSLLSGGEKSMTALAFLFAVFLARPCPFYILDEVEAALDDLNLGRFLELLRAYRDQAQFIVVTHQRRTMEAADALYGVSMGGDGVSKIVSRRLAGEPAEADGPAERPLAA